MASNERRSEELLRRLVETAGDLLETAFEVGERAVNEARELLESRLERFTGDTSQQQGTTTTGPSLDEMSRAELYERAKALDIPGRSKMSKSELLRAVRDAAR